MSLPQKVLLNTLAQAGGKLALLLASVVTLRLTTGYLGVERFGELSIVLAFALLLTVVADLGIATVLARELAKTPERADELGGTLLVLRLAGAAAVFVVFAPLVPLLPYGHDVRVGLLVGAAGVIASAGGSFPTAFFQVHLRLDFVALLDAIGAALTVALVAVVVRLDLGFLAVVAVAPAVALVTAFAAFALSRRFWRINVRTSWALAGPLVRDALPIGLVGVLGLLHFRIDSILLSVLRPSSEVGIYTVAYKFLEQALVLPALFMAAVFPILTRCLHARTEDADGVIRRSFHFLLLLGLPLTIATFVLARPLVHLVSGPEFDDAVLPLRILAPALVLAFVNTVFAGVLFALNRRRALIGASLVGLALNVLQNLAVIPFYGYRGAAVTTVVSELVGLALTFVLARRAFPFSLGFRFVARLGAAGIAMAGTLAVLLLAGVSAWVAVVPAGLAFAAAAYGFKAVTWSDVRLLLAR